MSEKIFLEKNRNVEAINKDNYVDVNLTQKVRLLPFNDLSDKINLADLFNDERDNCDKYRFIFTVNPICTNALYNMKTEVVYKEGSNDCVALVDGYSSIGNFANSSNEAPITREQAIRDTEYSHQNIGPLVYHCGIDIFNNHLLRSRGFVHINKLPTGGSVSAQSIRQKCKYVFNTIYDYQRDCDGNIVSEYVTDGPVTADTKKEMHVYRIDNIMSMQEAFNAHMKEKDGWFGFTNVGTINIPNGKDNMLINKLMNNNKACEFIDMYPDRSLYSFIPKVNKYRNRIEKNWDYCITYPYQSDENMFRTIMSGDTFSRIGIRTNVTDGKTQNGHDLYVFTTIIKHNLAYGDSINITWPNGGTVSQVTISGIGDVDGSDPEHCFRIYKNQLPEIPKVVWIQRLSNGAGCKYYFRKFKKILNPDGSELASSIGKLAFGENIYGDRVAEVVYTDDVNISGLRDNMGRKLSELYFTVIKTNRGHDLWYNQNVFNDEKIEFSHCFGKVTSGVKLVGQYDYNVYKMHNVKKDFYSMASRQWFNLTTARTIENNITESKDWFYGDIIEFDPATNKETVLEDVYHRFNTEQRETLSTPYTSNISADTIIVDDYETSVKINSTTRGDFETGSTTINDTWINANIQPEGYYYKPHHRIKIREISNNLNTSIGTVLENTSYMYFNNGYLNLTTSDLYGYVIGDVFAIYDKDNDKICWGVLDTYTINEEDGTYTLAIETKETRINLNCDVILTDGSVPPYASYIPLEEKFVWRDVLSLSETQDNDLSNMMFTNGANYIHQNINFYLRRQDPFGENGLSVLKDRNGKQLTDSNGNPRAFKLDGFKKYGIHFDASGLLYLAIETQNACL